MTNSQCQGYALFALKRLIGQGLLKTEDTKKIYRQFDCELSYLFDRYSEEEAEAKAIEILQGDNA